MSYRGVVINVLVTREGGGNCPSFTSDFTLAVASPGVTTYDYNGDAIYTSSLSIFSSWRLTMGNGSAAAAAALNFPIPKSQNFLKGFLEFFGLMATKACLHYSITASPHVHTLEPMFKTLWDTFRTKVQTGHSVFQFGLAVTEGAEERLPYPVEVRPHYLFRLQHTKIMHLTTY